MCLKECKSVRVRVSVGDGVGVRETHWEQNNNYKNNMSVNEAKSIEINETDCDNPISLDEIEKGLWLGLFSKLLVFCAFYVQIIIRRMIMTLLFISDKAKI